MRSPSQGYAGFMTRQANRVHDAALEGHDVMTRVGRFADRDAFTATGWCSIERALDLIGTRSAMMLVREAFYGGRRFDELASRTGLSDAVTAKRLKQLVEAGVMAQQPYRVSGARTRHEYLLTERGRELFPVVVAMVHWGDGLDDGHGGIEMVHAGCGEPIGVVVQCAAGHGVAVEQTEVRLARSGRRRRA